MDQRNFAQHWRAFAQFGQVYKNLEKCNNTYRKVVSTNTSCLEPDPDI